MAKKEKDACLLVELAHKHVPRELDDYEMQRRQRYENTYDMNMDEPIVPGPIERLMKATLETLFSHQPYQPERVCQLATEAADEIKKAAMKLVSPRVRLVCHVTVVQKRGQATRAISRCLWDPEKDRAVMAVFENQELIAVAAVYALFYE